MSHFCDLILISMNQTWSHNWRYGYTNTWYKKSKSVPLGLDWPDVNEPLNVVRFETFTIFYNYFDAKSLKISLNPARMSLVCSICLFCASRNISADLSYLALSSSILRSHISKNLDCHSGAMLPSLTSGLFLFTLLRLFSSVFLFSRCLWPWKEFPQLFTEILVSSAAALEAPLSPLAKVALSSIVIFDGSTLSMGPILVEDPKFPLQSSRQTWHVIYFLTFVTSESLEAVEEGDGVLAASGISDSVRQGTIGVVNWFVPIWVWGSDGR